MNPEVSIRVATLAVVISLLGCDSQRLPVGPSEADLGVSLVEILNPGSVSIRSETGILRFNNELFNFGAEVTWNGSVSGAGVLIIPRANIVFPDQFLSVDSPIGTYTFRLRFTANNDATGQIGAVSTLTMSLRLDIDPQGSAPPGFGSDCRITPINLLLSSTKAGGVAYNATTGRMTIADHGFDAPGAEGCGTAIFGAVNYNHEINNAIGFPTRDTDALITAVTNPRIVLNSPPSLTPPAALEVGTNSGCTYIGPIGTPTATDDEGSSSITNDAPGAFPLGTTTVTWTATDASGNATSVTQEVTVFDDDAPVIAGPPDVTVSSNSGVNYVGPIGTASATDNCSSGAAVTISSDAPASFPPGTTLVTWTATDASGNAASAFQQVTVELAVEIDILPGTSFPIKLSGFVSIVTVLVRTTPDADAALITAATATLGDGIGTEAAVKTYKGTPIAALLDVDRDGDKDLVVAFDEADLVANGDLTTATTTLVFQAERTDGSRVRGAETVTVIP